MGRLLRKENVNNKHRMSAALMWLACKRRRLDPLNKPKVSEALNHDI